MTADEIICTLGLVPLPGEGGYFRETYRSSHSLRVSVDGDREVERSAGTVIYYMITPEQFSALHRLRFDEVFHFYLGDPVEMLTLSADGAHRIVELGPDLANGQRPQHTVAAGTWQGCRLKRGGRFALLGTSMAPGFDFSDFELGTFTELAERYPQASTLVRDFIR